MLMWPRGSARRQRGLSLVELMVGITIGLIVVAAASLLVSGQLTESRRLIAEAQVQQDLRASADIIARELRRSGGIGQYDNLHSLVWKLGSSVDPWPYVFTENLAVSGSGSEVTFNYYPDGAGSLASSLGFKLEAGVIRTNIFAGGWQDLTDPSSMEVTAFSVTRVADSVSRIPCPKPCPSGDTSCWPSVRQRTLEVRITARHRAFPEIERTQESRVRLRNDQFSFFDSSNPLASQVCPP
jgi:prepilin-type N-terminal cleavage/methylation domain-containing protein